MWLAAAGVKGEDKLGETGTKLIKCLVNPIITPLESYVS